MKDLDYQRIANAHIFETREALGTKPISLIMRHGRTKLDQDAGTVIMAAISYWEDFGDGRVELKSHKLDLTDMTVREAYQYAWRVFRLVVDGMDAEQAASEALSPKLLMTRIIEAIRGMMMMDDLMESEDG